MHKDEILFQPWAVWYCHNHPDKTVRNAKAITVHVTKDFAGHTWTKELFVLVSRPHPLHGCEEGSGEDVFSQLWLYWNVKLQMWIAIHVTLACDLASAFADVLQTITIT